MISAIILSLLAGFFTWIFLDLIVEALFPRLMDPSVTQRLSTPRSARIVSAFLVCTGITVTIVVFALQIARDS